MDWEQFKNQAAAANPGYTPPVPNNGMTSVNRGGWDSPNTSVPGGWGAEFSAKQPSPYSPETMQSIYDLQRGMFNNTGVSYSGDRGGIRSGGDRIASDAELQQLQQNLWSRPDVQGPGQKDAITDHFLTHHAGWMEKASPYIAAAGMGALTFGAGLGAGLGGGGAAAGGGGTSDLVAEHMLMTGAAGGMPTTAGLSAGAAGGAAAGTGAAFSGMEGTGGGAATGGGGGMLGADIPGYTGAQNAAGAAAGGDSMIGAGAGGGAAAGGGTGGSMLQNIGSALDQGSAAKNIATYGPVIWSGIEYANGKEAAQAYQDQLQKNIQSSDPFGPERAKYQQQLDELMKNPQSFLQSPQVQFASDAAARKMASMGYNQSPAQAQAIADASIGQYYNQANLLAGLSGSQISPNSRAANDAAAGIVGSKMGTDAAGGNLTRQLIDSMFSTGSSGKSGTNGGDSGTKIGDRAFSYLDKLV